MLQVRWLWLLATLLLLGTNLTTSADTSQHLHRHEELMPEVIISNNRPSSPSSLSPAVGRLGYLTQKALETVEKVRLYAFSGKGDDVKPSQWPELKPGWRLITSVVLVFVGASICSAGGVGGGGIFIPIFNLLLQFDAKTSAALSNFVIFGGSLANLLWNLPQNHPVLPQKPMINYDVALILQPNMLLGISIGVICNVMFPGWLIIVQLAVIVGYMTLRSTKNAMKRWRVETLLAAVEESDKFGDGMEKGQLQAENIQQKLLVAIAGEEESKVEEPLDQEPSTNSNDKYITNGLHTPLLISPQDPTTTSMCYTSKIGSLALVWLAFLLIQLLRGNKTTKGVLPLQPCGVGYWLLTATQIPLAFFVTVWTAFRHPKKCLSESQEEGESLTRSRALTIFPGMAFMAGLLGGMLGVGGGMIINPLLTELGMHPQVTAATSAFMVFFSSSMSVLEFWLLGRIPLDFALFFAVLCFAASLVGLHVVHRAIAKYGRASIIVFSVSIVMGISAIMMASFGSFDVVRQYMAGAYMGFHTPCS